MLKPHFPKGAISCSGQARSCSCSPTNSTLAELLLLTEPPAPGTSQNASLEAVAAPADLMGRHFCFQGSPVLSGSCISCSSDALGSSRNMDQNLGTDFARAFIVSFPVSADNLCDSAQGDICSQTPPLTPEGSKISRWERKGTEL